jgi:hypothetical protein
MHRLAVGKKYNSQISPVHFRNRRPTPDSTVVLNHLAHGICDHMLNPLQTNRRAIRRGPHRLEVARRLHLGILLFTSHSKRLACRETGLSCRAPAAWPSLDQDRFGPNELRFQFRLTIFQQH